MNEELKKEIEILIKEFDLNCSVEEFKDKVDWNCISKYQKLSEDFIREFKDKVDWYNISSGQQLSEDFIREFKDKVNWINISSNQKLSENFIREFKDKISIDIYNSIHSQRTYEQKLAEVEEYCKEYNLELDKENKCFYAYRRHDEFGRGLWNRTIFYEKGKYYRDWHLDMRKEVENSFGLGIFPKGDTKVKVLIEDWGVYIDYIANGKCRVWGFEVI